MGRTFFYGPAERAEAALEIPVGVQDFRVLATADVDAELQLFDPRENTFVVEREVGIVNSQVLSESYHKMEIDFSGHTPGIPGVEKLEIHGQVTVPLSLMFHNHGHSWSTVSLDYSFAGLAPCPVVPVGCSAYNEAATRNEIEAWSSWARSTFESIDVAWVKLAAPFAEGDGRRLEAAEAPAATVPWYRFEALWVQWGEAPRGSWPAAFHFLDGDQNGQVGFREFSAGFELGAPPPGGFSIPGWIVWVIPLMAIIGLCAKVFLSKDYMKSHYHNVSPSEIPVFDPKDLVPPTQAPRPPVSAPDPVAPQKKVPAHWFQMRSLRGCDSPFSAGLGRLGLLDCGIRGKGKDTAVPGKPQCAECGWQCRCPGCTRKDRSLPPVLAWRGPDECPEEDEIESTVRSMRADPWNQALQHSSCGRLEELALGAQAKRKIADAGGIEAIIEAMRNHANSPGVQESACGALGNEALRSDYIQHGIGQCDGISAIIGAMDNHMRVPSVQEKACWALQQLAMASKNRSDIARVGGIKRIVQAMDTHRSVESLQEHGCMALGNLGFEAESRRLIAEDGGIEVMVGAMQKFPNNDLLQENGCFVMHNLACSDDIMRSIADSGGIEAACEAMRVHPQSPGVQENAIGALHNVNCGSMQFVHKAVSAGAVELVTRAMQRHRDPGLQAKACHVLGQLGDRDEDVRELIVQTGGSGAIEEAKLHFSSSKEVQRAATDALKILKDT